MKKLFPLSVIVALLPVAAHAHTGLFGGHVWAAGLAHPISGADHVLAMVAVGLWAAALGGRALWALPAAFVAAMVLGGALGVVGADLQMIEPMILASIIILGAAVALALRAPMPLILLATAVFGAAHGYAHGVEGPSTGLGVYTLGFATATLALHLVGIALARALPAFALRGTGLAVASTGLILALA
ncbi:MAG: HupE/UreJ family protein [Cypionkella sp.]|nr:HupE/UreJ family protein [Cypionkella sp.]